MPGRPFLRCLGQPVLYSPVGEPVRFRTKKHLALLVYLALEPAKPHRRDRLAELLWPTVAIPEGRHSLATALSVLRPRLGPGILQTTREHVLIGRGKVELDIERLESGDILGSEAHEPLQVAGFLEGFDIPHAPEFALWKDRKSASLLPLIKAALVQLIDQCRRTADARQIELYADTMLALDELSEEAVRAKMEARAFSGDRLTALRVYEEWRDRLEEAVGAQPSALVEGMAVRLRRRGWERTDTVDIPTVPTDQWRGRLFVGRYDEYRSLYEAWEQTKRDKPQHAMVVGDSGVGKTTLVERLVTATGLEGAAVSRVQCYDLEKEIPYAALGNLTRGLLELPGVSAAPPEALAELARYFNEVRRRFPSIPSVEESIGETARLRLTDAFHQTLEAIAEDHPVILVVDDLHLCDEASLSVIHLLMNRVGGEPIMFVFAARAGELPNSPLASRLLADAQALGIKEIWTRPLAEAESHKLLAGLLAGAQTGVNSALRRALVRVAGGFPMVLELLVQDWEAHGSQSLALALDSMTSDFGNAGEAPDLYRKVLDRMAFALDQSTRNVLNVAAVLGHRLNDLTLYEIADLGAGQVMAAMADLVRHRVLRDGGRNLEFINEFVRTAAYLEVPSPVRRTLHASIARRLIGEEERGVQFLGLEIAWHAIRAGGAAGVAKYLLKGAQQAKDRGALDEASRALSTALPHLATEDRQAAALLLAEALEEQGRWAESASILAAECANEPSGLADVLAIMAAHRTGASTADRLVSDVQHLQSLIAPDRPLRVRLLALDAVARLMGDVRSQDIAHSLCQPASALREESLSETELTQVDLCIAQLLYYAGHQGAASDLLSELAARIESKGVVNSCLARVYGGLGAVSCYRGRYDQAKIEFRRAYALAREIGNEPQQAGLAANVALCCLRLGEYAEQLEWNDLAALVVPSSGYQKVQGVYYRAFGLAMLGRVDEALALVNSPASPIGPSCPAWLAQAWRLHRADILALAGEQSDAMAQAREAVNVGRPILHAPAFAGAFARWLAITMVHDQTSAEGLRVLRDLYSRVSELDALDRVEVLCAQIVLGTPGRTELADALTRYLAGLPPAVATQLRRLGALGI